ncbi:MAG: DUF4389 domain-containing protein [Pseudomonadales bacterium]|nr:DUF4389 domain-containing protein [Pseudomonadales bacterium]
MSDTENQHKEIQLEGDSDPILLRLIYMIAFYFVLAMSRFVVGVVALVQFFHLLFTETPQEDLLKFARSLGRFINALVGYLTFTSNEKPFPFTDWPSDDNVAKDQAS